MRRRFRADKNQGVIVSELRAIPGVDAEIIHEPVDLVVYWHGNHLVDIKNPDTHARAKGGEKRTASQIKFAARWPGPVHFCESTEEILQAIGAV